MHADAAGEQIGHRAGFRLAEISGFHLVYFFTLAVEPESNRNCFGHEMGGFRHMPSARAKAQTLGIEWLEQMSGLVWRQPSVCVSESFGLRGA